MRRGAFATILDSRGRVLLCHRRDLDLWNPPGGRVEPGEAPWDAVVREVFEETCLDVEAIRLASVSHKTRSHEVLFQFLCEQTDQAQLPQLTDESDAIEWFDPGDLPALLGPALRRRLAVWLADRDTVHLLVDEGPSTRELIARGEL